jgi:hypothetical protein
MPLVFVIVALGIAAGAFGLINVAFPETGRVGTVLNWTAVVCFCLGLVKAIDWLRDLAAAGLTR